MVETAVRLCVTDLLRMATRTSHLGSVEDSMQRSRRKRQLSKLQAVVLAFARMIGRPIHKTKLVKLVYLLDNHFYEHTGRTLTGLEYVWDNHGPNAISNAIVMEADDLVNEALLHARDYVSMYGTSARTYGAYAPTPQASELPLEPTEREFIAFATDEYGSLGVSAIVAAAKSTTPFRNATQYQRLELIQREEVARLRRRLEANPRYLESLEEDAKVIQAEEKAERWVSLEAVEEERNGQRGAR